MPERNLDRIREILIEAVTMPSEYDDGLIDFARLMKPGDSYQLYLMENAGLIEGNAAKDGFFFVTNRGADFYDAVKEKSVWDQTKTATQRAGAFTLEAVVEVAKSVAVGTITAALIALKNW